LAREEVRTVWETNVFGVLAVYQAMLPLLGEAPQARIINVSGILSLSVKRTFYLGNSHTGGFERERKIKKHPVPYPLL
jgi:NAD(P)-dependent dehydrogenase (short-subunit alcohol dehydrogenase family)